ncbi:MAG: malate dehydrogenase [Spirochaetaceae bacterium]|nr:MAG: malate dehydrogenase [Spirochaetaceae bacterium]
MTHFGIVGSGNLGANVAFFAAERAIGSVCLYDAKEGLSTGKALDMMEAAPLRNYQYPLRGTDRIDDALDATVVLVSVGAVREPGQSRLDLYERNRDDVAAISKKLRGYRGTVIVATEPVDLMVRDVQSASGLPAGRVLGAGCVLDSMRLRYLIASELHTSAADISATVIGPHSERMMPLRAYCTVAGVPIATLIPSDRIDRLFEQVRGAGDEILNLAKRSTSYYGPAAAIVDVAEAVLRDSKRVLSVSTVLSGQYGVSGVAMSLPVVVGSGGAERILEPMLDESQRAHLSQSAESLSAAGSFPATDRS